MHKRNGRTVKGVSCHVLEGPYPTFAEDNLICTRCHQVLGSHQPLLNCSCKASLQKNRHALLSNSLQQLKVLHVPCPYLHDIDIGGH